MIILLVGMLTFLPEDIKSVFIAKILKWSDVLFHELTPFGAWFSQNNDNLIAPTLFINNLGHISVFFFVGYALARWFRRFSKIVNFIALIVIAGGSELLQHFVAGRQPDLDDLTLNIIAGLTGYLIFRQLNHSRQYRV
ncbi:MAG: VanZ family protein [Proteobacteria bacterium]|nr:VanZ family protein [Pseudomonadota bacterium]